MAILNKVGSVSSGIYTNPNTLSRNLAGAYNSLGTQINTIVDILSLQQRSPVLDVAEDNRWTYAITPDFFGASLNPAIDGLDGTTIFTYAGSDYGLVDPIFLITNPDATEEKRPATLFESFIKLKQYTDTVIAQRSAAIISMVTGSEIDLSGADEGAVLQNLAGDVAASSWKFMSDAGDYILRAPGGNYFVSNATQIKLDAPEIKFVTNHLILTDVDTPPTGALGGVGRIYYSIADAALHLVDHYGVDIALGEAGAGGGWTHTESILDNSDSPVTLTMSDNSYTYLVDMTAGAVTINLPALSGVTDGTQVVIADASGLAPTNNLTIDPNSGDYFIGMPAGEALIIDTSYGTVGLQKTSIGWLILYTR
jgi:hypothetical protein